MAEVSKPVKAKDEEVITINIQPFLVPVSILLSFIILSSSMFIGLHQIAKSINGEGSALGENTDATDDSTGDTTVTAGQTTIDDDAVMGDKNSAKVAIVMFSDYECPYCYQFHTETFDQIKTNFVDTGKAIFVYRDFPLSFHEPAASTEAEASECVQNEKGDSAYFTFGDLMFRASGLNGEGITESKLQDLAAQVGMDKTKFQNCIDAGTYKDEITDDTADGTAAGITGTPGFVIGTLGSDGSVKGELVEGAQPYATFEAAINKYL